MTKPHYETLDAMRGVAALAVVFYHGSDLSGYVIAAHGYLAVDLFFVLSGFVIGYAYDRRLSGDMEALTFINVRVQRFYPLYVLGIALGACRELMLILAHTDHALSVSGLATAVLLAMLFLPYPATIRGGNLFPLNVPSWSLFYELLINIIYAATFRWVGRRSLFVIVVASGIALCASVVDFGTANTGPDLRGAGIASLRTVFSFSTGLLLFRIRQTAPKVPSVFVLLAVAACLMMPNIALGPYYDLIFIVLVSPALVAAGASSTSKNPVYKYLGTISFAIYALHSPLLHFGENVAELAHLPGLVVFTVIIAGLLLACPLIERWYDLPARRWLKRRGATS